MYVCYLTIYKGEKLPPYYIGSTSLNKIENGYRGSVVSKKYKNVFKNELKTNPELFDIIILSKHDNRKEAIEIELLLQKEFDVVKSDLFFNEAFASINGMFGRDVSGSNNPMFGKTHSEETKKIIKEKRGNEKRYEPTEEHKKIISFIHKNKILSKETKLLISKNRKEKNCGYDNPMFGKTHSEETKKKISDGNSGKIKSEETRKKISNANKGKIISEETRKKISNANKGKIRGEHSEETRKKISNANKGRIMSEQAKQKLISSKTGMKYKESVCPYCNKKGSGGNMKRYHFENCKNKLK